MNHVDFSVTQGVPLTMLVFELLLLAAIVFVLVRVILHYSSEDTIARAMRKVLLAAAMVFIGLVVLGLEAVTNYTFSRGSIVDSSQPYQNATAKAIKHEYNLTDVTPLLTGLDKKNGFNLTATDAERNFYSCTFTPTKVVRTHRSLVLGRVTDHVTGDVVCHGQHKTFPKR